MSMELDHGPAAALKPPKHLDYSLTGENARLAVERGLAEADWYQTPVPRRELRKLLERRNGPAIRDTLLWFGLLGLTGWGTVALWGSGWVVFPYALYAVLYATASDSRWHECSHGTAFKSDWMNNLIYEISCFMVLRESVVWRWSHTRHLGIDKLVWIFPGYRQEKFDPNDSRGTDPWGVPTFKVKSGAAVYQEYGEGPLADMEETAELADYPLWPDPAEFNLQAARELAERAREFDFATLGPWVSHFEIYCHMRGMENALMDLIAEPEFVEATLDRIESIQTDLMTRVFTEMGGLIDVIFISDDLGTQQSQLMSLGDFERHLKPRIARWCDLAHRHGKKVLFHTDGSSRNFVPHLIDAGVDILNPIQHICPGMDRAALKRDFGDRVIFHGGVENQRVLPHGGGEEVRAETRTCLETLGAGGGYIACSCHNIQAGTPVENILAMIDEVGKSF